MILKRVVHKTNFFPQHLNNENFLADRIGFWGIVIDQNSKMNSVTVVSDTGYQYDNLPVASGEWVTINDKKNYIPSQRNLPPINSRVFVLTPTKTATGAFVLCSGFSRGDENIRELWAQNDDELEEKNNSRETKTQGGWDIIEDYSNGNSSIVSNDEEIQIFINTTENNNKEQSKEIKLLAWDNSIIINEDGISVTDINGNTINRTSNGIYIEDKSGNIIETQQNNISISVKNGSTIEMDASKITLNKNLEVLK